MGTSQGGMKYNDMGAHARALEPHYAQRRSTWAHVLALALLALCMALAICSLGAPRAWADGTDLGLAFDDETQYVATDMGRNPAGKVGFSIRATDAALATYQQTHAGATMKDMLADWVDHVTSVTVGGTRLEVRPFDEWKDQLSTPEVDAGTLLYCDLTAYTSRVQLVLPIAQFDTSQEFSTREVVIDSEGFATVTGQVTYRNIGADSLTVRVLDGSGTVLSSVTLTDSQLKSLNVQKRHNTAANCGMAGLRSYCSEGVLLTDVLAAAGVDFAPGMTVKMRVNDMLESNGGPDTAEAGYIENATFTYEDLVGTDRYYYPAMWDDTPRSELGGRSMYGILSQNMDAWKMGEDADALSRILGESKQLTQPVIAWSWNEGVVAWGGSNPEAKAGYNGYTDQSTYRLLFGMKAGDDGSAIDDNTTFSNVYGIFGIDVIADGDYRLFSDVDPSGWYAQAVSYIYGKGLMTGYANSDMFGVGEPLTRAQLAVMLWRYADPAAADAFDSVMANTVNETGMADVEDASWYTGAANWAVANGVINGVENVDGTRSFNPNDEVPFEQMMAMVVNLIADDDEVEAADVSALSAFSDASSVSDWARPVMAWAYEAGLYSGADGAIKPLETVARERAAAVLFNGFNRGLL